MNKRINQHLLGSAATLKKAGARLAAQTVDLVFPPRCPVCSACPDSKGVLFCDGCATLIGNERRKEACPTCAATVGPFEVSEDRCRRCRGRRPGILRTARVGAYTGALGQLTRSYKYSGRDELGPLLGGWLTETVLKAPGLNRLEAVVSVPTHWRRRARRPLHAAEALAGIVAERLDLPHLQILRRTRAGPHQIGLSYSARTENVRGAFAVRRGVTLREARLLMVDDVKTTGATLNECAKVLHRAGAGEVRAAVVVTVHWDPTLSAVLQAI